MMLISFFRPWPFESFFSVKFQISEFLQPPMAGFRGAGGMGASGPNRPRPETADSCDNLARLSSEPGLKWCHPVPQLEQPAPCCLAGCAGTLGWPQSVDGS